MDLICANSSMEDIGVVKDYKWDLAYGSDENNFECEIALLKAEYEAGWFLYIEGTEYGGIIDDIAVDTAAESVTYKGRTWHGILESKVLAPDSGNDYLTVSGEAHAVLRTLIARMGLTNLFSVSEEDSGIKFSYKFDRYVKGYTGIRKMLRNEKAKLMMQYNGKKVILSAVPAVNYAKDESFDSDQIAFKINQSYHPVNHIICLGHGELKDRMVVHIYADADGNISGTKTYTGLQEIEDTYDYANAESEEELTKGGIEKMQEAWGSSSVDFDFDAKDEIYDIGDIVGATERTTGTSVAAYISKKIVTITKGTATVDYETEAVPGTVADSGYPSSGGGGSSETVQSDYLSSVLASETGTLIDYESEIKEV